MGKMIVYYSGYIEIKKPEIIVGRNTKGFGKIKISNTSNKLLHKIVFRMSWVSFMWGGFKVNGREDKKDNDLFFTCSLIEYIVGKTKKPLKQGFKV